MVWSFTHPLGHARPSVRLSRDPFAPVGTSLGTALYIPCVLQPLQRPSQRGDSPFSQMRKQVQRGQAQGYSLSKWPIQNSSEVWLRSTFMAPVSLGPPAGVGWNSKGSWGVRAPQAPGICCRVGSAPTTQLSSVSLPSTPWGPHSALNGHPDSSPTFRATADPQILLPPSGHATLGKFPFSSGPSFLLCKMERHFSVMGSTQRLGLSSWDPGPGPSSRMAPRCGRSRHGWGGGWAS